MRVYVCVYIYIYIQHDGSLLCCKYPTSYQHPKKPPTWRLSLRQAGLMTIRTDDMETAGEMVQDLCSFLQVHGGVGEGRKWGLEDEAIYGRIGRWRWMWFFWGELLPHLGWNLCVDQGFLRAVYGWYTSVGGIFSGRNTWVWWNWRLISGFRRLHGVLKWPYMTCIGNVFEWFAYRIVQSLGESFLVNSIKPQKTMKDYSKLKTQKKRVSSSQNPLCFWRNLRFVFSTQP